MAEREQMTVTELFLGPNGNRQVQVSGAAAPTAGDWKRGDIAWFASPSAGGPPGAICTASGTPGTWKNMANVAA